MSDNGIKQRPMLFHGIRDLRGAELERAGYKTACIDAWLGNSEATKRMHYDSCAVTVDDRRRASAVPVVSDSVPVIRNLELLSDESDLPLGSAENDGDFA